MTEDSARLSEDRPLEDRLSELFRDLGLARAHMAARQITDWQGLVERQRDLFASLTLVCPFGFDPGLARNLASRLLVIGGDTGAACEKLAGTLAGIDGASFQPLPGCTGQAWDDTAAGWRDEVGAAMLDFLAVRDGAREVAPRGLPEGDGEVAGITYRIRGSGPPLVLFPLMLAPSQWEPLVPLLGAHYCTFTLGGPHLGGAGFLETRARAAGYLNVVKRLIDEMAIAPGQSLLDVGSGSGAIDRWFARRSDGANPITGVDVNAYLIGEATDLARREGLGDVIEFREANALSLPFAEDSFDHVFSSTVMEELDARRMLAELVRVTKPGGRIGVITRAVDLPRLVNLPLPAQLKAKLEAPGFGGVDARGCADASLYARFIEAGLCHIRKIPQIAAFDDPDGAYEQSLIGTLFGSLDADENTEARAALASAREDGTFLVTTPFHGAVGTKN